MTLNLLAFLGACIALNQCSARAAAKPPSVPVTLAEGNLAAFTRCAVAVVAGVECARRAECSTTGDTTTCVSPDDHSAYATQWTYGREAGSFYSVDFDVDDAVYLGRLELLTDVTAKFARNPFGKPKRCEIAIIGGRLQVIWDLR